MLRLEWIKNCIKRNKYYFSGHGDSERQNEDLMIVEVEEAILSGQIIEQYPDTGRSKSCLIVGFTKEGHGLYI